MHLVASILILTSAVATAVLADDFPSIPEALNPTMDIVSISPAFDFDHDGCLPSAAMSVTGVQNGRLNPSGALGGGCRRADFLAYSNTYHRAACMDNFCAHFYCLYFLKDQAVAGAVDAFGHRHDIEFAAIWTTDGAVTHAGTSAHGDVTNDVFGNFDQQDGRAKIVYHKDGGLTHAMRFAKTWEVAENSYGTFVTPPILDWDYMMGDQLDNAAMKARFSEFDFGKASFPILDGNFINTVNKAKPDGYPTFA